MAVNAGEIGVVRRSELTPELLAEFGRYAAARNARPDGHIGYAGLEPAEVTADFAELDGDPVFAYARTASPDPASGAASEAVSPAAPRAADGAPLCGLLCAEWDVGVGRAWLYGPWAGEPELMDRLYAAIGPVVPAPAVGTMDHEVYCDAANTAVAAFARRRGFTREGESVILRFPRARLDRLAPVALPPLTPDLREQFAALHDRAFPGTYAPAEVLLDRAPPILVETDGPALLGYVTLKLRPEFGEAQIEYVAVAESARGRGVGARLVTAALRTAFADDRYDVMDLVTPNPVARRLYEKVGFTLLREMRSFRAP
jgi:ribosomal protein S18 acetylase RimI-like enzyme